MLPNYLQVLFSRTSDISTPYNLRNNNDFVSYPRRTALFEKSFVPSAIDAWNNLPEQVRNNQSIGCFKRDLLKLYFPTNDVPPYYYHGMRYLSIIHTRLRNNCSSLKSDLYNNHVSNTDKCEHCNVVENAGHYFFRCSIYINQRTHLFTATRMFHPLNTQLLLFGNNQLSLQQNIIIVEAVHQYIKSTRRFT